MKSKRRADNYWTAALWIGLIAVFVFYTLGAAVSVSWGSTDIPVSVAIGTIDWSKILHVYLDDDFFFVFAVAGCLAVCYTLTSSWRMQITFMVVGLIFPIVFCGTVFAAVMPLSPFMVFEALSGRVNGEFYVEDMPQVAAVGLWMILCLVFAFYQLRRGKTGLGKLNTQPSSARNAGSAGASPASVT